VKGTHPLRIALRRFLGEETAQDLVEYALLVAFIGLTSLAAWTAIQTAIQQGYIGWDTAEQNLWEPPNP
jgi:Flp pilus assembly pilin Flp